MWILEAVKSKDHHFVPRHYLRQFRVGETKQIATAMVDPYRFVGLSAIGDQCKEKYFYGEDGALDRLMWQGENDLAPVLERVIKNKRFDDKELVALRMLVATLNTRTRRAVEEVKVFERYKFFQFTEDAIKSGRLPPAPPDWGPDKIDIDGVPGFLIKQNTLPIWMELQTLKCALLEPAQGASFITSDDPVALLNPLFADAEPHRSFVGFGRSGFQCVLPLSPKLCALFYDAKVYKVGNRRDTLVSISDEDVAIVNGFQVQSAENCVYFHDLSTEPGVQRVVAANVPLRTPLKDLLREIPGKRPGEVITHVRTRSVRLAFPWQFCSLKRHPKIGHNRLRDASWSSFIEATMTDMRKNPNDGDLFKHIGKLLGVTFEQPSEEG